MEGLNPSADLDNLEANQVRRLLKLCSYTGMRCPPSTLPISMSIRPAECWWAPQVIKLPANKYTVREKEMLSNVVPVEFFEVAKSPWLSSVLGIGLLGALGYIW